MSNLKYSAKELAKENVERLNEYSVELKRELFNLRFQQALGELKNTSRFSFVRRAISRVNTELTIRRRLKTEGN